MKRVFARIEWPVLILALLLIPHPVSASEWSTVALQARPLDITANGDVFWVCGADELIANSRDGGKTWNVQHLVTGGALLLAIGAASDRVLYAAGTGGAMLFTKDGGTTWTRMSVPASVIYAASFSDEQHGLIRSTHTIYRTSDGGASWQPITIDLSAADLKGFRWARALVALDPNHMIVVMSDGNSRVDAYKLLMTKDGGGNWRVLDIPSTGLSSIAVHDGEYWVAGFEVIEKDKPGGGYGVPLVMHSADGETWTHLTKWAPKEFSECNSQSCLFGDGSGMDFPATSPQKYWTFPSEKAVTAKWAVAHGSICSVGTELKCAAAIPVAAIPSDTGSPTPTPLAPPPLDAPPAQGLECISCDIERIIVTDDYQGVADVELKIRVGVNGLVDDVQIVRATKPEIGDRIASQVRNWIFVPYEEGGAVHPALMSVKLSVQAIKSK